MSVPYIDLTVDESDDDAGATPQFVDIDLTVDDDELLPPIYIKKDVNSAESTVTRALTQTGYTPIVYFTRLTNRRNKEWDLHMQYTGKTLLRYSNDEYQRYLRPHLIRWLPAALHALKQKGYIHNDLAARNVTVFRDDFQRPQFRLIDFGKMLPAHDEYDVNDAAVEAMIAIDRQMKRGYVDAAAEKYLVRR